MATRCSATTASGHPCRAWAVRETKPPRCSAHGGGERPVGAPEGNTNAVKHGFYSADPTEVTIDEAIAGLVDKMTRLDDIIATANNGEYVSASSNSTPKPPADSPACSATAAPSPEKPLMASLAPSPRLWRSWAPR